MVELIIRGFEVYIGPDCWVGKKIFLISDVKEKDVKK